MFFFWFIFRFKLQCRRNLKFFVVIFISVFNRKKYHLENYFVFLYLKFGKNTNKKSVKLSLILLIKLVGFFKEQTSVKNEMMPRGRDSHK